MKVNIKNKENIDKILNLIRESDEGVLLLNLQYEVILITLLFESNWISLYRKDDILGDLRLITNVRLGVIKSFIVEKLNS